MTVLCAYCGQRRAVNRDHVIPYSYVRRYRRGQAGKCPCPEHDIPADLLATVPACFECNTRKGTRKLVPPSWADKIPALKAAVPGQWRVWHGSPSEPAFSEVHK